jgi:hypothetical protein
MKHKYLIASSILTLGLVMALSLTACNGEVESVEKETGCTECHNETTLVLTHVLEWEQSLHSTGTAYARSSSASCAGCHSSEGFAAMLATDMNPGEVTGGETNPSPPNCRTCHEIHTSYTIEDFALRATDSFTLYTSGEKYDFGDGNLCANCHQPRRSGPVVGGGDVEVDSTHWGPHHGVQATSFIGIGGYGVEPSRSRPHYEAVSNGCPQCHMANDRHEMEPDITSCEICHSDIESFDYNGVQTEVEEMLEELVSLLEARGLLEDGHPVVGTYPEEQAGALWNYIAVVEDGSLGVHDPDFIRAILQVGIDALSSQ